MSKASELLNLIADLERSWKRASTELAQSQTLGVQILKKLTEDNEDNYDDGMFNRRKADREFRRSFGRSRDHEDTEEKSTEAVKNEQPQPDAPMKLSAIDGLEADIERNLRYPSGGKGMRHV